METQKQFGLLGKNISYSFSRHYFSKKFESDLFENCTYENFDLQSIVDFPKLIQDNPNLKGLNVTIPYKEEVVPYLDKLSKKAKEIGAVNTIKFTKKGQLKGYNSDWYGFKKSIKPYLKSNHKNALILGSGGASKAIAFALKKLNINYSFVTRNPTNKVNAISYEYLNETVFENHTIIINTTPLGTFPDVQLFPNIPYQFISKNHLVFDAIYNPEKTKFLEKAELQGATILNGYSMLVNQAEKSWKIWNT